MATYFDYLTVACFLFVTGAFFFLTDRAPRTLVQMSVAGLVFAVANQLGNADYDKLAIALVIGGMAYAAIILWLGWSSDERR